MVSLTGVGGRTYREDAHPPARRYALRRRESMALSPASSQHTYN